MIDPNKKARDADRDAAIDVVEAAYVNGQITQADSELRVERLRQAGTVGEVQTMVRDLRPPEEEPGVSRLAPLAPQPPAGAVPPAPRPPRPAKRLQAGVGVMVAMVVLFAAVGLVVPLVMFSSVDGGVTSSRSVDTEVREPEQDVELTTARGYDRLVAAVEKRTGSATVFTATIYPGYAVVDVPVDGRSQRSSSYYYDGRWQEWTGSGTHDQGRFELDRLDGSTVATLLKKVTRLVEDPSSSYVLVNPRGRDAGVCLSAYALNEFEKTAYLDARCDGTVVRRYTS